MFAAMNPETVAVNLNDPGGDNKNVYIWRAPVACEIRGAHIVSQVAQSGTNAGEFGLKKQDGTVIAAALGGTAADARLGAGVPKAFTISEGTLAAGDWVVVDYQENGDWTELNVVIALEIVYGVGA